MTTRTTAWLGSALAACALALPAGVAHADCPPGAWLCAQLQIGGGVYVEPAPPPPPPRVVYVEPAPPPPPVVVYQPAPPQPVVYYRQPVRTEYVLVDPYDRGRWGLHGHVGGLFSHHLAIAGLTGALRVRPRPHFAFDFGIGAYGGVDYNGLDRVEVPLTVDGLFFFNPRSRFQFYGLLGVGLSFAHAEGFNSGSGPGFADLYVMRDYAYYGGELGIGLEWRMSRWFAINGDIRGFLRHRFDGEDSPEFTEYEDGKTRSTDTSGGVLGTLGATLYF